MKKRRYLKFIPLALAGIISLTSCFGKTISREEALQILDQIIAARNNANFSLGPSIIITIKTTELQGLDVLETNEEYHVVQSEGLGRSFVYHASTKYLGEELLSSETYWAFNRNGQFNEIIKKKNLVSNLETEDPNDTKYEEISECNYLTDVIESSKAFWGQYGEYYAKAQTLIAKYDKPQEFKDIIDSIPSLKEDKYKIKDKYTTTGNRSLTSSFKVKRATTSDDRDIYNIELNYLDAILNSYIFKDFSNNSSVEFNHKTTSSLFIPAGCEVEIPKE
jgi:hypothetical protein